MNLKDIEKLQFDVCNKCGADCEVNIEPNIECLLEKNKEMDGDCFCHCCSYDVCMELLRYYRPSFQDFIGI